MTRPVSRSSRRATRWPLAVVAMAVAATLLAAYMGGTTGGAEVGQEAPAFHLVLYDGRSLTSESLRGSVVVLHFWGSWCAPCRAEAPVIRSLWETYAPQGVQFLGVAYQDVESKARAFLEAHGWGFPNGSDPTGQISRAYGVRGVPETYVIGPDGVLVRKYIGPVDEEGLAGTLEALLGGP